jgi:cytochrome c oxidase assembly protein subunit 16
MAVFPSKKFRPASHSSTIAARYRSALTRHPFALFGLPFIVTMVAGSFFLTPATAIRYEKHDRRVTRLSKEEELGIGKAGRRVDMKEEYYVSSFGSALHGVFADMTYRDWRQRTWTIGIRSVSRDCPESTMVFYECGQETRSQMT